MPIGFLRICLSYLASLMGDQFLIFCIPLIVFRDGGSLFETGISFVVGWTVRILGFALGSVGAARFGERRSIVFFEATRGISAIIALLGLLLAPSRAFEILCVLVALDSFFWAQSSLSFESMLPKIFSVHELPKAQGFVESMNQASRLLGPALSAFLAITFSAPLLLIFTGVGFLLNALNFVFIKGFIAENVESCSSFSRDKKVVRSTVDDFKVGWQVLRSNAGLQKLAFLSMFDSFLLAMIQASMVPLVFVSFGKSESSLGLLNSVAGFGGLAAGLLTPFAIRKFAPTKVGVAAIALQYCGIILLSVGALFYVFGLGFIIVEIALSISLVYLSVERARMIPANVFPQTLGAVFVLHELMMPAAGLLVALLGQSFGLQKLIFATALACLAPTIFLLSAIVKERKIFDIQWQESERAREKSRSGLPVYSTTQK